MTTWDASAYARQFSFVPEYGRELIDILNPQKTEKILDLGCGTGALTAELAARGCQVAGVDGDANMIALARQTHPTLSFEQQDAHVLTWGEPLDGVFSNAALHWMKIDRVFPRVATILRPGGRFVAEMGGVGNIAMIERAIYRALARYGITADRALQPWAFPSPAHAAELLEKAGFEVRFMHLYDRLTKLGPETGGVKGWVKMFGRAFVDKVSVDQRETFLETVEEEARPDLYRSGEWYADYRRFHFVAIKL